MHLNNSSMELSSSSSSSTLSLLQWLPSSFLPPSFPTTLLLSFIAIFITYHFASHSRRRKLPPPPPKVAGAWPLMGHLHLLGGNEPAHAILGNIADKYGSAFTVNIGTNKQLVVSSNELLKECFTATHDKMLSYRPIPLGLKHMFYNAQSFGFAPYGDYWRELRKFSMVNLLSNHCVEMFKQTRTSQVNTWFKKLYEMCTPKTSMIGTNGNKAEVDENSKNGGQALVELKSWFDEMVFNALIDIIVKPKPASLTASNVGADEHEGLVKKYKKASEELGEIMSCVAVSDLVKCLGWLDYLTGLVSRMKRHGKAMDSILTAWLEQHKSNAAKKKKASDHGDEIPVEEVVEKGFVDKLLSAVAGSAVLGDHDHDVIIKSTCQVLIFGGVDSTAATLTWAVALLLNNLHVLRKAREELDEVVGKERLVEDSDINNLVYLQAILKETMRLYPVAPILERIVTEDCTVGGFHVKAGTGLWVNVVKVQRDPKIWSNPLEFKPERFLHEKDATDFNGKHYELLPFGLGRRICPAVTFSNRFMLLILARLIHSFELNTAQSDANVDMSALPGFSFYKATPLEVIISPRLDSKIYG